MRMNKTSKECHDVYDYHDHLDGRFQSEPRGRNRKTAQQPPFPPLATWPIDMHYLGLCYDIPCSPALEHDNMNNRINITIFGTPQIAQDFWISYLPRTGPLFLFGSAELVYRMNTSLICMPALRETHSNHLSLSPQASNSAPQIP